ncbi:hypothetical protein NXC24_PB00190 (plasmid) [Rhizobium sp. NXC24]|nr:hypothetical protein NXC24_PB00190 [Rhizobium sp. NXC24]
MGSLCTAGEVMPASRIYAGGSDGFFFSVFASSPLCALQLINAPIHILFDRLAGIDSYAEEPIA